MRIFAASELAGLESEREDLEARLSAFLQHLLSANRARPDPEDNLDLTSKSLTAPCPLLARAHKMLWHDKLIEEKEAHHAGHVPAGHERARRKVQRVTNRRRKGRSASTLHAPPSKRACES